jgi:hypothetical protein
VILERFVMLGKTVPEASSDGREMVCSAGYDRELKRLVRIYPLGRYMAPPRWSINSVQLQRNPKDSRDESWQLATILRKHDHDRANQAFIPNGETVPADERYQMLSKHFVDSINEANERRLSLALIRPKHLPIFDLDWKEGHPDAPQMALFDRANNLQPRGTECFPFVPRLEFEDEAGGHRLQLRDWGIYEYYRKTGTNGQLLTQQLAEALHINESSYLLIGNLCNKRNAWLVISVLNLHRQESLFDSIGLDNRLACA